MHTLVLTDNLFAEIVASIRKTRTGVETGVTLFGTVVQNMPDPVLIEVDAPHQGLCPIQNHVVLAIAGPGTKATHQAAHYSGDENYASEIFAALGCTMPGLKWLGELHVHPRGMTWLSAGDHRTIREILTGTDDTVHPEEFIAGVIQRKQRTIEIFPYYFARDCLKGTLMTVRIVKDDTPLLQEARFKAVLKERENERPCICT